MKQSVYTIQCPPFWLKTPPLALIYLENYLRQKGFNAKVNDLNIELFKAFGANTKEWLTLNQDFENNLLRKAEEKFPDIFKKLHKEIENFDFIGFSLLKRNAPFSLSLAQKLKEKFPAKKIILGGPQTSFLDRQGKLDSSYYWVIGEGETALAQILGGNKDKVYRFREINHLDDSAFLDFDSLGIKPYSTTIPLFSSRGCIYNCNFCSEKNLYKKFRHHSSRYMFEQIKQLKNKYKTNDFVFCDSLINYSNTWLSEFCSLVIDNKLNIKWQAQMRIDKNFSIELGSLMRKSGCYNLFIGLESASDKVLSAMNKGFTKETALSFLKKLHQADLQFEISLIFGYPAETEKDFKETLDFIVRNKKTIPKIAQANPFVDYLGNFLNRVFPDVIANERIKLFLRTIETEKIKYTKSFINNLIY